MMDDSDPPAQSTTPAEHLAWAQRVASVQRERATPEVLEALSRQTEAHRHMALSCKRARRISRSISLSSSAWSAGVQSADAAPRRSAAAATSAMQMLSSPAFLASPTTAVSAPSPLRSLEEEEAEEEAISEQLDVVARQSVTDGAIAAEHLIAVASESDEARRTQEQTLEEALASLVTEPTDPVAVAAKFELYEGYAKLTEDARAAVLELWSGAQADLDAANATATKQEIQRQIAGIDRADNLGIADDPRHWFVHSMCTAVRRNQCVLDGVLRGIQSKLELLSSQTECPICLDQFSVDRPPTTLSCAHKACTECWTHWCAVAGGVHHAPCPLCRHQEFLRGVMRAAGEAV